MIEQLSQQTVNEYASDALTIQEPQGADYSQGVQVGKTIPAKWWNWLFNAVTKRVQQSRTDAQNMLTELQNVVTDAGIALDSSDSTQLTQAIVAKADTQVVEYVRDKRRFASFWQKVSPKGLLPVPDPASIASPLVTWIFNPVKTGDIYWTVHGTEDTSDSGRIIYGCIVFSRDLENWHTFDTSTIDITPTQTYHLGVSLTFFKGTYYMCLSFLSYNTYTQTSTYVILSSQDAASWSVEVKYQDVAPQGIPSAFETGNICSVNNKIMCYIGRRQYVSSDGANWSFSALPSTVVTGNFQNENNVATPVAIGTKYMIGNVLVDGTVLTPMAPAALGYESSGMYAKLYKLQSGNIVSSSGFTVDCTTYTATPIVTGNDKVVGTLLNNRYILVYRSGGTYEYSEDGINFTALASPLPSDIGYTLDDKPICELNGKLYYSNRNNGYDIFESDDLIHWTNTGNHATNHYSVRSSPEIGVLVSNTQYSYNKGALWQQAKDSDGANFFGTDVFTKHDNKYFAWASKDKGNSSARVRYSELFYAENFMNRVIGHTLYLR